MDHDLGGWNQGVGILFFFLLTAASGGIVIPTDNIWNTGPMTTKGRQAFGKLETARCKTAQGHAAAAAAAADVSIVVARVVVAVVVVVPR